MERLRWHSRILLGLMLRRRKLGMLGLRRPWNDRHHGLWQLNRSGIPGSAALC